MPTNSSCNILILAVKRLDGSYRLVSDVGSTNEAIVLIEPIIPDPYTSWDRHPHNLVHS